MANEERMFEESEVDPSVQFAEVVSPKPKSARSILDVLLDPRTLQGLMFCGAGLLVLGLVVWLWSIGVFENRLVVATCLGVGNAALVAVGVSTVRYTRYQTAGKAITLLGCLLMPLNLWFYDAQGLITLDQGGHLWVPALICCVIYVIVARVLADPMFVYAIVGGVTMTGLLILADHQVGRFWEILSPSALLVVLGMLCIHVERAFSPGDGPFSRERFGKAFFNAGHAVMASGLILLLGGRLVGRFYEPLFADLGWFAIPAVATQARLKLIALGLALAAAYSYVYSQLVVKARGRYVVSAVLTLLWCAVILLDLLAIPFTVELVALLLAVAAVGINLSSSIARDGSNDGSSEHGDFWNRFLGFSEGSFVTGLHVAVLLLGLLLYGRARVEMLHALSPYAFSWTYVAAMLLGGISCWWSRQSAAKSSATSRERFSVEAMALLGLFAVVGALGTLGMELTVATLALEMVVPLVIAGLALASRTPSTQLMWSRAAELPAILVLITVVGALVGIVDVAAVDSPHLWLTLIFGAATLCFGQAAARSGHVVSGTMASVCLCGSAWQFLLLLGATKYVFILAATLVGIAGLGAALVLEKVREESSSAVDLCRRIGKAGVSFGGAASLLLAFSRVMVSETEWSLIGLLLAQLAAAAFAGLLAKETVWRRFFVVLAVAEILMAMLVVNSLSTLTFLQRGEIFVTVGGLLMLGAGYFGWFRETDGREEVVSMNLAVGSILSATPMICGLVHQRFFGSTHDWGWIMLHEVGVLAIGLGLLASGLACRIRWSKLMGSAAISVYVVSLLGLVRLPEQLQSTAIYMMVGGGLFFAVAVLLSVYRDRLLALPQKMRDGEGVFQVLKWR